MAIRRQFAAWSETRAGAQFRARCGTQLLMIRPEELLREAETGLQVPVAAGSVLDVERASRSDMAVAKHTEASTSWTPEALQELGRLAVEAPVQGLVIQRALRQDGWVSRDEVYEIGEYPEGRQLKGFTRPVNRLTDQLRYEGRLPEDAADPLVPIYDEMKKGFGWADGFQVPMEVVSLVQRRRSTRVYELAKELGLTNKECLELCISSGVPVKSHATLVDEAQADRVRRIADNEGIRRETS